jgi:hypothetical protein
VTQGERPLVDRLARLAIVLTPAVALATVALGLRVGASTRARGARVYVAPQGAGRPGIAVRLVTMAEESGVLEVVPERDLVLEASSGDRRATWRGSSNAEGVAEGWLDLGSLPPAERVTFALRGADGVVLASGEIAVPPPLPRVEPSGSAVHAARTSGPLVIEVYVYGGALVPGEVVPVLARVRDAFTHEDVAGAVLNAEPEPGLRVTRPFEALPGRRWYRSEVTAEFLTASWAVTAQVPAKGGEASVWVGALPVSPGAAGAVLPPVVAAGTPLSVHLSPPPATRRLYVEVDDQAGRDFAAALEVNPKGDGAGVELEVPPLAAGDYWLVTSSDPHGSETLSGTTIARPFHVGPRDAGEDPPIMASLVTRTAHPIARPLSFDGLSEPRRRVSRARRRGMLIALGALVVATLLEALLVVRAARGARKGGLAVSEAALGAGGERVGAGEGGGLVGVAILVLVTLLGFALTAALLSVKG